MLVQLEQIVHTCASIWVHACMHAWQKVISL